MYLFDTQVYRCARVGKFAHPRMFKLLSVKPLQNSCLFLSDDVDAVSYREDYRLDSRIGADHVVEADDA